MRHIGVVGALLLLAGDAAAWRNRPEGVPCVVTLEVHGRAKDVSIDAKIEVPSILVVAQIGYDLVPDPDKKPSGYTNANHMGDRKITKLDGPAPGFEPHLGLIPWKDAPDKLGVAGYYMVNGVGLVANAPDAISSKWAFISKSDLETKVASGEKEQVAASSDLERKSGGLATWKATFTIDFPARPVDKLQAIIKADPVERGGQVTLDGSRSTGHPTSYSWKVKRLPCASSPGDTAVGKANHWETPEPEVLSHTGPTWPIGVLCDVHVELEVTGKDGTSAAETVVHPTARSWRTEWKAEDPVAFIGNYMRGRLHGGATVCADCASPPPKEGIDEEWLNAPAHAAHYHHRPAGATSWLGVYEVGKYDVDGPFKGWYWATKEQLKVHRQPLWNVTLGSWLATFNDCMKTGPALALVRTVAQQHELQHVALEHAAIEASDVAQVIEGYADTDEATLIKRIDGEIGRDETRILDADGDAAVSARLAPKYDKRSVFYAPGVNMEHMELCTVDHTNTMGDTATPSCAAIPDDSWGKCKAFTQP
jgi:hypothetical protein